jgi:hypothetical protein
MCLESHLFYVANVIILHLTLYKFASISQDSLVFNLAQYLLSFMIESRSIFVWLIPIDFENALEAILEDSNDITTNSLTKIVLPPSRYVSKKNLFLMSQNVSKK